MHLCIFKCRHVRLMSMIIVVTSATSGFYLRCSSHYSSPQPCIMGWSGLRVIIGMKEYYIDYACWLMQIIHDHYHHHHHLNRIIPKFNLLQEFNSFYNHFWPTTHITVQCNGQFYSYTARKNKMSKE